MSVGQSSTSDHISEKRGKRLLEGWDAEIRTALWCYGAIQRV